MALHTRILTNQQPSGVTALAGAAPLTVGGNTLSMIAKRVAIGTLSATVIPVANTNTLTIAGKWQVSRDGSTWVDAFTSNNAAQVVMVTGTGSPVTVTRAVEAPDSVYGHPFVRYAVVTGVATATTGDSYSIAYNFRQET